MTLVNLSGLSINDPKLLCMPIRKRVHGFKREVEAVVCMIDGGDVDRFLPVRYLPARPTGIGVPTPDSLGGSDVGKRRQGTKITESLCEKAVRPVGASDGGERAFGIVKGRFVVNGDGRCGRKECHERDDGRSEFHGEDMFGECALANGLVRKMLISSWSFYPFSTRQGVCARAAKSDLEPFSELVALPKAHGRVVS